jgi:hypothetical protein
MWSWLGGGLARSASCGNVHMALESGLSVLSLADIIFSTKRGKTWALVFEAALILLKRQLNVQTV